MPNKSYKGEVGRKDVRCFEPQHLVIITDEKHPLYDERIHLPVDQALVASIGYRGIIEPVVVTPDGDRMIVVDGRQRVRAALELNNRGHAPQVQVPCIIRKGAGADLADVMVMANEIRRGDEPIVRARKMQRLLDLGRSEDQVAVSFGCTKQWVRTTLKLLDCAPEVQTAVAAGKVTTTRAAKLAKLPRDEQAKRVEQAEEPKAKPPGRPLLKRWLTELEHCDTRWGDAVRTALDYILGNERAFEQTGGRFTEAAEALERAKGTP